MHVFLPTSLLGFGTNVSSAVAVPVHWATAGCVLHYCPETLGETCPVMLVHFVITREGRVGIRMVLN